jgi:lipopolysaccharide/colanic/teichoic acid biosynthesis glycosyltransferase
MIIKRIFDIIFSLTGLIICLPLFIIISILIIADSKGSIFYKQIRVGKDNKDFRLLKFRTMMPDADKQGLLTVSKRDNRITRTGHFLRKYKLDELAQLFNVLCGNMSIVGPRPEVRKYVELYNEQQKKVLLVKPGITCLSSVEYINENEILGKSTDFEKIYINDIMPAKLILDLKYISEQNFITDIKIIFKTLGKIIRLKD